MKYSLCTERYTISTDYIYLCKLYPGWGYGRGYMETFSPTVMFPSVPYKSVSKVIILWPLSSENSFDCYSLSYK